MPSPGLRICFLLSTRGFLFGGLETIADQLATGLARRGHHVTFIAGLGLGRPTRRDLPAGLARLAVPVVPHTAPANRAVGRLLHLPPLHLQSLSFVAACLVAPATRRALQQADVAVTFLEAEAVLVSRLLGRRGVGSIHYFAGAIDLG